MKQHLLLVLVAFGLVAVTPTEAQAGVHSGFSFGFPAYYGASPTIAIKDNKPYYSGYSQYKPYWSNITTGIDVHIDITVTIFAKIL
jgi:hypothetical protein